MQQLQFLKPTLLDQINAFLGGPRFRIFGSNWEGLRTPPGSPKTLLTEDEPLDQETLDRIEVFSKKLAIKRCRRVCARF